MFWACLVHKESSDISNVMLNSQKAISDFAKLKTYPGMFFRFKKNDNFLPQSLISRPTLLPVFSVLFFRLFYLNPQSL
jgi:hypothetical protein